MSTCSNSLRALWPSLGCVEVDFKAVDNRESHLRAGREGVLGFEVGWGYPSMWITALQVILRWLGIWSRALRTEFQPELGVLTSIKIPYSTRKVSSTAGTHLAAPLGALQMREVAVRFLENDGFWRKKEQCVQVGSAEMLRLLPVSPVRGQLLGRCHQP